MLENPPITAEQLIASPRENCRRELREGEILRKPYRYVNEGLLISELLFRLGEYVDRENLGHCVSACGFIVARNPDTVFAPPIAFVARESLNRVSWTDCYFPQTPTLAVEVRSHCESVAEVHEKARLWIEAGCEAVWLVWTDDRSVTVYRLLDNIRVLTADKTLDGEDVVPGFAVKVAEIFTGLE